MTGPLVLVGGGEWSEGCTFDRSLLETSGATEVVVVPTASAYERPSQLVAQAQAWFASLGVAVRPLDVLGRRDAFDPELVAVARNAKFLYLAGASPMHLRSVLKDSPMWDAMLAAWADGAVLAASSAAAMALCDPMVDLRGGAFTLGLGLIEGLAVVPHFNTWSPDKAHRTRTLAPKGLLLAGIDERTSLIRYADGTWRVAGEGAVHAWRDGEDFPLDGLP